MFAKFTNCQNMKMGVEYRLMLQFEVEQQEKEHKELIGLCEEMLPTFTEAHPKFAAKVTKALDNIRIPF